MEKLVHRFIRMKAEEKLGRLLDLPGNLPPEVRRIVTGEEGWILGVELPGYSGIGSSAIDCKRRVSRKQIY